jgi:hypothetical protein
MSDTLDDALDVLRDHRASDAARRAAFAELRGAELRFDERSLSLARFVAILRDLVDDRDLEIRLQALEILAAEHDPFVRHRLLADVLKRADDRVPLATAIRLLAYDGHGGHLPICRVLAADRRLDENARIEALRALAADPHAEGLLVGVFTGDEPPTIRLWAGLSLRTLAPQTFAAQARRMLANPAEDPDLRTMCDVAFKHSRVLGQP